MPWINEHEEMEEGGLLWDGRVACTWLPTVVGKIEGRRAEKYKSIYPEKIRALDCNSVALVTQPPRSGLTWAPM